MHCIVFSHVSNVIVWGVYAVYVCVQCYGMYDVYVCVQ